MLLLLLLPLRSSASWQSTVPNTRQLLLLLSR
jgi:hypothetical protein